VEENKKRKETTTETKTKTKTKTKTNQHKNTKKDVYLSFEMLQMFDKPENKGKKREDDIVKNI